MRQRGWLRLMLLLGVLALGVLALREAPSAALDGPTALQTEADQRDGRLDGDATGPTLTARRSPPPTPDGVAASSIERLGAPRGAWHTVVLEDSQGARVESAWVQAMDPRTGDVVAARHSDPCGFAVLRLLPNRRHRLRITPPSPLRVYDKTALVPRKQVLTLHRGLPLAGRVLDARGRGLSYASLRAVDAEGGTQTMHCDVHGWFRLDEVAPGEVTLHVTALAASRRVVVREHEGRGVSALARLPARLQDTPIARVKAGEEHVMATLPLAGYLDLRLVDLGDERLDRSAIERSKATLTDAMGRVHARAFSPSKKGRISIGWLPKGITYTLFWHESTRYALVSDLRVDQGEVPVPLQEGASLRGTIRTDPKRQRVGSIAVSTWVHGVRVREAATREGDEGLWRFELAGLPPGDHTVHVELYRGDLQTRMTTHPKAHVGTVEVEVRSGLPVEIDARPVDAR